MSVHLSRRFVLAAASGAVLLFVIGLLLWGGSGGDGPVAAVSAGVVPTLKLRQPHKTTTTTSAPPATTVAPSPTTTAATVPETTVVPATTIPHAPSRSTTASTTPPAPPPAPPPSAPVLTFGDQSDAALAAQIVADHNRQRAAWGLAPLQRSGCLDAVASSWAGQLGFLGQLLHNPTASIGAGACMFWQAFGENIGYDASVDDLESAWMASSVHAANILDPDFTQIGVGVVHARGMVYAVVDFAG